MKRWAPKNKDEGGSTVVPLSSIVMLCCVLAAAVYFLFKGNNRNRRSAGSKSQRRRRVLISGKNVLFQKENGAWRWIGNGECERFKDICAKCEVFVVTLVENDDDEEEITRLLSSIPHLDSRKVLFCETTPIGENATGRIVQPDILITADYDVCESLYRFLPKIYIVGWREMKTTSKGKGQVNAIPSVVNVQF